MVLMVALMQQKKSIKSIIINLSKAKTKFCLSLRYSGAKSYLYVNKTEICKFKANYNISRYNFCLRIILKGFTKDEESGIF